MGQTKMLLTLWLLLCAITLHAGTYTLANGQTVSGDPVSYDKNGVVFGNNLSKRIAWNQFTQESLQLLKAEAKKPQDGEFIDPFLQQNVEQEAQRKEIVIKPVDRVELPKGKTGLLAGLASPLGLVIFLVLYAANLYAAYQIALFKNMPVPVVCGPCAALPFLGPIVFLCIPARPDPADIPVDPFAPKEKPAPAPEPAAEPEASETPAPESPQPPISMPAPATSSRPRGKTTFILPGKHTPAAEEPATEPAPAQPVGPIVTFKRGEFTFNRRFFETKLPGFLRVVPSEAEKDMVLQIRCARGEFIGKRISKITQTEVYLEVFKEGATADEMIPYNEIYEIQMRHKDSV